MGFKQVLQYGLAVGMLGGAATLACAAEGVLEINQTCAVSTGCFPGDQAGFPVDIDFTEETSAKSFRLTSQLHSSSVSTPVIRIRSRTHNVTIDLNGFAITGGGFGITAAFSSDSSANITVRNGVIEDTGNDGVVLGVNSRVENIRSINHADHGIVVGNGSVVVNCVANDNADTGIVTGAGSLVVDNVVRNNRIGLALGEASGYRGNVITANSADAVTGSGIALGLNICDGNTICP